MLKLIVTFIFGAIIGFLLNIYFQTTLSVKFLDVRLFEIIQFVATFGLGSFIAYYFSRRLNSLGKRKEIIYTHLTSIIETYQISMNKIYDFMSKPASIEAKEITLTFKHLSAKISTIEKRKKIVGLDNQKIDSLVEAHNKLNEIIIGESWGIDSSKMTYTEIQKQNVKKEYN